jgi:raffinose/stachyose/melibiose transport system substrate-binding protein
MHAWKRFQSEVSEMPRSAVGCLRRRCLEDQEEIVSSRLGGPEQSGGGMRRRGFLRLGGAAGVAAVLAVTACSGPGPTGAGPSSAAAPSAVNTKVGDTAANLTLFSAAGLKAYSQGLTDAFMKKYPKITVKLQVEADNNYNTVLPRLLASDTPPDLAAPADLLGGVKDGLLTNLDAYAKAYGWDAKVPSTVLAAGRVSNAAIGIGSLYTAGGAAGPLVGVFYNRELAAKVGMTAAPASLDELEAVMDKAKAAGITPIVASNSDGLIGHLYSLLLSNYMGSQKLLDVTWHAPGATLDTPEAKAATARLEKWMKAGYFNPDANAVNQDASYGQFAGGKGLFMIQGTWIMQSLPKSFDGKYGIFAFPPTRAGGQQASMTSNSLAFAIAAKSEQKDAAALFLDFLTGPEAAAVAAQNGYPSAIGTGGKVWSIDAPITEQIQAGYSKVAADNGFSNWLQNATKDMTPVETAQLQSLLAGKTTADAVVAKLQATYAAAK